MREQIDCGGRIQVIFGPMFSGKTTELIRRLKNYHFAQFKCFNIKYARDTRYDQKMCTHDRQTLDAHATTELLPLLPTAAKYDVIGVDEGQFFPDIVEFAENLANRGKVVIVAALDGTFQRKGFGDILNLVPLAEEVVKLKAVCMSCYRSAHFTKRISTEQQVEVIGGSDKYIAACRSCHGIPIENHSNGKSKEILNCKKASTFGNSIDVNTIIDPTLHDL